jgi:hypothetical protein
MPDRFSRSAQTAIIVLMTILHFRSAEVLARWNAETNNSERTRRTTEPMPLPGASIYRQLQDVLDQSRASAAQRKQSVELLDDQLKELVERKGTALLELAQHYLPEFSRSAVETTFAEIRSVLLEILGRKERTRAELIARAGRFVELVKTVEEKLEFITQQLNQHVRQREELEIQVADRLKADSDFQTLSHDAAQMEARLQQNEARVRELQATAHEKLPPYEQSSLFQYLYHRGYGTSDYQATGMTKSLDRWVAKLIDFPKARNGYEFLKNTPKLMADEVARRQAEFKSLMEKIEAIEYRHSDEAGLTSVLEEGRKFGAKRDEVVTSLEKTRREQAAVDLELQQLDQKHDAFYEEAIRKFEQFLGQTETGVLQSRAQRTPDPRDDEIVSRIADLTAQIERLKPQIAQATLERKKADELAGGMDLVINRFRQNNFDSERSSFADALNTQDELDRYLQGLTKPEELWQIFRRQQQFEPTWAETVSVQGAQVVMEALNNPAVSRVLVNATAQVVDAALNSMAQSGIERRAPERQTRQAQMGRPPSNRPFTTHDGF